MLQVGKKNAGIRQQLEGQRGVWQEADEDENEIGGRCSFGDVD